ncbi:MAG TPA: hypothetical protein VNQ77_03995 [Frankiaceae bacterium]|nr:hypothetical protein [Frankiaceae bacterium]
MERVELNDEQTAVVERTAEKYGKEPRALVSEVIDETVKKPGEQSKEPAPVREQSTADDAEGLDDDVE